MKKALAAAAFVFSLATGAAAQEIIVTPSTVTVYSQGATTVFLTFTNVVNRRALDACWCGELKAAAPDAGFKCREGTEYGCLPVRYNQSRLNTSGTYTDIMSIPPSVARRAYLDAVGGAEATFFYVRRFVSTTGEPDEYVPVTLRLSGNGASVPFSITNVKLQWGVDKTVILVKAGEKLPKIHAEVTYTGTGRLEGRWEIVKPGEELPETRDLLTESTLPVEERGRQRRFTQLSRFNVFLPPIGRVVLPGPELWRVPNHLEGRYAVLLRIEAATDSNAAPESPATGGVAGFSLPVLRYYVGAGTGVSGQVAGDFSLDLPDDGAVVPTRGSLEFSWNGGIIEASFYLIELQDSQGKLILSATVAAAVRQYQAPSWLIDRLTDGRLQWRVVALDRSGNPVRATAFRILRVEK